MLSAPGACSPDGPKHSAARQHGRPNGLVQMYCRALSFRKHVLPSMSQEHVGTHGLGWYLVGVVGLMRVWLLEVVEGGWVRMLGL